MKADPEELSPELLERFRAALHSAGAPLGNLVEPGLTDEQIDQVAIELGVRVPPELRVLWRWGQPSEAGGAQEGGWDINPRFELWPPPSAITATRNYRALKPELGSHIAIAGPPQGGCLLVRGDQQAPTSRVVYALTDDPDILDAAPSLGALFQIWTAQLANGDYAFAEGEWQALGGPLPFP